MPPESFITRSRLSRSKFIYFFALAPFSSNPFHEGKWMADLYMSSSKSIDEMWARESENRIDADGRGEMKAIPAKEVFGKIDRKW